MRRAMALPLAVLSLMAASLSSPPCRADDVIPAALPPIFGGSHLGVSLDEVEGGRRGARVAGVVGGSPAERAGIAEGDVVVEFDGEAVRSALQLTRLVRETPAGRPVDVVVERDGTRRPLKVTLDERRGPGVPGRMFTLPVEPPVAGPPLPSVPGLPSFGSLLPDGPRLGIRTQDVEGQLAEYFGVGGGRGVLVTSVDEGSPAARAGLRAGDVITALGGQEIRDTTHLRRELAEAGDAARLSLVRDRKPMELDVSIERAARDF